MQRITSKASSAAALGLLLLIAAAASSTMAQNRTQPRPQTRAPAPAQRQWLSVQVVRVKPEMLNEWLDFQRNEVIPALQKGGVKQREVWQTAVFGEAYEYVFVTPIESFAQYDSDSPIIKALGQEGARAFGAKARRFTASSHTYATQTRPDLGYEGKMTGPPKLAVVTSVEIASGRNLEFESFIKNDIVPVLKRAEVAAYSVGQTVFGGNANEYVTLAYYDKFAELDKGPATVKVLGQEGTTRLLQKTAGIVTRVERIIVRYNAELSFPAQPALKAER
jgi:hypothetical protein